MRCRFATVVALGFVTLYGNRTPRWEDWFFVPFITGAQRVDLSWLWEDVQGHRVPIAKLVLCACYTPLLCIGLDVCRLSQDGVPGGSR